MPTRLKSSTITEVFGARKDISGRRPPLHPGEMLREEFMSPMGLSSHKLALDLHVPATRITEIVNERRSVSADTALRLARYFGMSAEFWMRLQAQYDLETAHDLLAQRIEREVRPAERSVPHAAGV